MDVLAIEQIVSVLDELFVRRAIAVRGRPPLSSDEGPQPVRQLLQHFIDGSPDCCALRYMFYNDFRYESLSSVMRVLSWFTVHFPLGRPVAWVFEGRFI